MTRGRVSEVNETRWSPNGYHYTRTPQGWRLTHHILAESKLGRPLADNERCRFQDGDRKNLDPENIVVYIVKEQSKARKRAQLQAKIDELQAQLAELDEED